MAITRVPNPFEVSGTLINLVQSLLFGLVSIIRYLSYFMPVSYPNPRPWVNSYIPNPSPAQPMPKQLPYMSDRMAEHAKLLKQLEQLKTKPTPNKRLRKLIATLTKATEKGPQWPS